MPANLIALAMSPLLIRQSLLFLDRGGPWVLGVLPTGGALEIQILEPSLQQWLVDRASLKTLLQWSRSAAAIS